MKFRSHVRSVSIAGNSQPGARSVTLAVASVLGCLFAAAMVDSSHAAGPFRVYAPAAKTQTLWVVDAVPKPDGGLDLKVVEKPALGFRGGVIAAYPQKPLLYISGFGGEPRCMS